ncbi:nitrate reductase molybdenum cofactor assembly chaperone [Actinoplanes sp. G11-F43]|uniref:nitrate reductase molybdenum cofactor assembly chaperone n=1 Tax=Actinoplanes sp. G11-F43 TaxID=3424130 RepID=UPI003D33A3E3
MNRSDLFQLASLLLTYPDRELIDAGPALRAAADGVEEYERFLDWLLTGTLIEAQSHYVQTFDLRRRSGLYLTYYLHGDTRKRGMALLMLKQRYRAHGLQIADGDLPDLLPIVLEFAAVAGPGDGEAPLRQHRQGIELLRAALHEARTPYALILDVVCDALPQLTDSDRAALTSLAVDGPPEETVGLGPDMSLVSCTPTHSSGVSR